MHIGKHIWQILKEKDISVREFAAMVHSDRCNIYRILRRESFDSSVLERYSRILGHNFFQDIANEYKKNNSENDINLTQSH